ncbi:hypothetical protein BDZ91DRAFT_721151 [Kalaharituber pfeilii]|nr:hypothetical protein BDZ91DRAFT_721151 [Kalaharituber pfeilii]
MPPNMRWTPEADVHLFRIVLKVLSNQKIPIPYSEIATEFGHDLSTKAVTHRIQIERDDWELRCRYER